MSGDVQFMNEEIGAAWPEVHQAVDARAGPSVPFAWPPLLEAGRMCKVCSDGRLSHQERMRRVEWEGEVSSPGLEGLGALLFSLLPWPNLCPCLLAVGLSAAPCTWLLPGLDLWAWTPVVTLPSCLLPRPFLTLGTSHGFRSNVITGFSPLLIPTSASLSMAERQAQGGGFMCSTQVSLPASRSQSEG